VTIGQATSEIRRRKEIKKNKEDLNDSGKIELPAAGGHSDAP